MAKPCASCGLERHLHKTSAQACPQYTAPKMDRGNVLLSCPWCGNAVPNTQLEAHAIESHGAAPKQERLPVTDEQQLSF